MVGEDQEAWERGAAWKESLSDHHAIPQEATNRGPGLCEDT